MDAFRLALEQGTKELETAKSQQRVLAFRISQLEAIVAQLSAFIAKNPTDIPAIPSMFGSSAKLFDSAEQAVAAISPIQASIPQTVEAPEKVPLWKAIINALNGNKGDFSVPQAVKALERIGRIIESKNRLNIVRNTLIQRDDIFGRFGNGHYFVRGFETQSGPTEKEVSPTEKTS